MKRPDYDSAGRVEPRLTDEIVIAAHVLAARGLVEGFGHVSGVVPAERSEHGGVMIITPRRALSLATRESLAIVDLGSGRWLQGQPPLEAAMHVAIYRKHRHIRGIVRTHSSMANTFGVVGRDVRVLHGFGAWLGDRVPVHRAATLVTEADHASHVADALSPHGALLLAGNGAVVGGQDVVESLFKGIVLEEAATLEYRALLLGTPQYWSADQAVARNKEDYEDEPVRAWGHYRQQVMNCRWV